MDPHRVSREGKNGYEPLPKDLFDREMRLLKERVNFFAAKRTKSQFILEIAFAVFSLGILGVALYYMFRG